VALVSARHTRSGGAWISMVLSMRLKSATIIRNLQVAQ
jgi:hypothetical protein